MMDNKENVFYPLYIFMFLIGMCFCFFLGTVFVKDAILINIKRTGTYRINKYVEVVGKIKYGEINE
jgi:hypothetical protein